MTVESVWEPLEWDSVFFGLRVARYVAAAAEPAENALRAWPSIDLGYLFADLKLLEVPATVRAIELDRKTTFSQPVDSRAVDARIQQRIEPADHAALEALAIESGTVSRFARDALLPRERVETLYRHWFQGSLRGELADQVLLTRDEVGPTGLITVQRRGSRASIGLLAVAARARGQGLARALVDAAMHWSHRRDLRFLDVVTQGHNAAACALYQRAGFTITRQQFGYHVRPC
jgi:dTDP-4-amino-4,6-dideoxy-D-galactose acyltransferase